MRIVIFGASGMVGQGVLRECLLDSEVTSVVSIVRKAAGKQDAKLREIVHADFFRFTSLASELTGVDACFFCLGVTSAGMNEDQYRKVTHDIALAAATALAGLNPGMTFVFVSGAGADSTGNGRVMWARVKGQTENEILALPLHAYVVRPAVIIPLHGVTSRTTIYRLLYSALQPLLPLLRLVAPGYVTTTEQLGKVMLSLARRGGPKRILESADITRQAATPS